MEKDPLIRGGVAISVVLGVSMLIHNVLKIASGNAQTVPTKGGWREIPLSEFQSPDMVTQKSEE